MVIRFKKVTTFILSILNDCICVIFSFRLLFNII